MINSEKEKMIEQINSLKEDNITLINEIKRFLDVDTQVKSLLDRKERIYNLLKRNKIKVLRSLFHFVSEIYLNIGMRKNGYILN